MPFGHCLRELSPATNAISEEELASVVGEGDIPEIHVDLEELEAIIPKMSKPD
jgi:hypothetical protein